MGFHHLHSRTYYYSRFFIWLSSFFIYFLACTTPTLLRSYYVPTVLILDNIVESADERDADTTTKALNMENYGVSSLGDDTSSFQYLHENGQFNIEGLSLSIPSDQMRMIQNINTLIAEVAFVSWNYRTYYSYFVQFIFFSMH